MNGNLNSEEYVYNSHNNNLKMFNDVSVENLKMFYDVSVENFACLLWHKALSQNLILRPGYYRQNCSQLTRQNIFKCKLASEQG